jgi:hypothetical protein
MRNSTNAHVAFRRNVERLSITTLQRGSGNSLVSIDLPVRVFREVKLAVR